MTCVLNSPFIGVERVGIAHPQELDLFARVLLIESLRFTSGPVSIKERLTLAEKNSMLDSANASDLFSLLRGGG